jgi:amidase
MTPFDQYVADQAHQQANRPDSTEKIPLDFSPFGDLSTAPDLSAQLDGATLPEVQALLEAGAFSSVELTRYTLARIAQTQAYNLFLEVNPDALAIAAQADAERAAGQVRGVLHGIPVALKGNIATADRMTTTAGAAALRGLYAIEDAPLVTNLREAGAVIIGKTNLSEWANFYAEESVNGYSTLGGHTRHPLGAFDVGGSSAGACAALSAGVVLASVGSETTGSIVYPASQHGVVGLKPTLGSIAGEGIIPITDAFDTAGPLGRTVVDVAILGSVLSGEDWVSGLSSDALRGVRVGLVLRPEPVRAEDERIRAEVVRRLQAAGAVVIDVPPLDSWQSPERVQALSEDSLTVMSYGFRLGVEAFLAGQPNAPVRTLAEVVAFNEADPQARIPSGHGLIVAAANATDAQLADYSTLAARTVNAYAEQVEGALSVVGQEVDVLADFANYASPYHSRAGFPALTLPAGVRSTGEPLGITLFGDADSDDRLLAYGFAFEQYP